jgi:lipoprotein-anchoring transpeptidase ErfK/SrfK
MPWVESEMFVQRSKSRRSVIRGGAMVTVAITAVAATACSSSSHDALPLPADNAKVTDSTPFFDLLRPQISTSVQNKQVGMQPGNPIKVSVHGGVLGQVTLTNADGKQVAGQLNSDGTGWTNTEKLGFGRDYKLTVVANGLGGQNKATETFTTAEPNDQTHAYFTTKDNAVVGVGQTVGVQFDERITDRKAAQNAVSVVTDPPVDGAFYWISGTELRWRPENFFKPGTKVTVKVNAYGVDLGNGLYIDQDQQTSFTIGDEVIAKVSDRDKVLRVYKDGKLIKQMPTSMGETANPTPAGIYMLGDHDPSIIMDSSTYGVPVNSPGGYRTLVDFATQMAYNGIYVHSAPWSVDEQGNTDVSHGCLNVSPDNAEWFLNNTKRGDIVEVSDTVGPPTDALDGLTDWNMPWAKWKAGNADQS